MSWAGKGTGSWIYSKWTHYGHYSRSTSRGVRISFEDSGHRFPFDAVEQHELVDLDHSPEGLSGFMFCTMGCGPQVARSESAAAWCARLSICAHLLKLNPYPHSLASW